MPALQHVEDEAELVCHPRLVALRNLGELSNQRVQVVLDLEILRFEYRPKLGALCAYSSVHLDQCHRGIAVSHEEDGRKAPDDLGIDGQEGIEGAVYTFLTDGERLNVGRGNRVRFIRPCFRRGNVEWRFEVVDVVIVMHGYLMHVQVDDSFNERYEGYSRKVSLGVSTKLESVRKVLRARISFGVCCRHSSNCLSNALR